MNPKNIVAYPAATSGHFFASVIAWISQGIKPTSITNTGSLHSDFPSKPYETIINTASIRGDLSAEWQVLHRAIESKSAATLMGHFRGLKSIATNYPNFHLFYVTVPDDWLIVQEKNFIKKIMIPSWSADWYKIYQGSDWPNFYELPDSITDVSQLPEFVVKDILKINRLYIQNWTYDLDLLHKNTHELPLSLLSDAELLYNTVSQYLEPVVDQNSKECIQFIKDYIKFNDYENRSVWPTYI